MQKYSTNCSGGIISKIMRRSMLQLTLALIFSGVVMAHPNRAQEILNREVTVALKEVTLKQALGELEAVTKVKFVFSSNRLKLSEIVTLEARKRPLGDVLNELLIPRRIEYTVPQDNDYIVL